MSNERICSCCGCVIDDNMNDYTYHDEIYCEDCFTDNFAYCERCEDVEPIEDMVWVESEDGYVCEWCLDNYYTRCEHCEEYHRTSYMRYLDGYEYCEECFDRIAYWCERCEEYVHEDNFDFENDCCFDCSSRVIGDYHSHSFYKIGSTCVDKNIFHKGLELEIENVKHHICNDEMAEMLKKFYEHIVFEHDGSLDNGFEIITQPHTLEKFNTIPWESMLQVCVSNGFRSHDTSTCGLHIHYSREWFGMNKYEQEDNIGKVIAFYERHISDLLKLSRRTWGEYQHWARGYDTEGDIEKCKDCAKCRNDRYRYINLSNYATVEFRLGRGTLNYESFKAWNNIHDCLIQNVKNVSYEDIDNLAVWFKGISCDTIKYFINKKCFSEVVEMYRKNGGSL